MRGNCIAPSGLGSATLSVSDLMLAGNVKTLTQNNRRTSCPGHSSEQHAHREQLSNTIHEFCDISTHHAVSAESTLADGLGCSDLYPFVCESALGPWHVSQLQLPSPGTYGWF